MGWPRCLTLWPLRAPVPVIWCADSGWQLGHGSRQPGSSCGSSVCPHMYHPFFFTSISQCQKTPTALQISGTWNAYVCGTYGLQHLRRVCSAAILHMCSRLDVSIVYQGSRTASLLGIFAMGVAVLFPSFTRHATG